MLLTDEQRVQVATLIGDFLGESRYGSAAIRLLDGPALADEVGLPAEKWSSTELARHVVRAGRTGKAVAVGLDWARDPNGARQMVVSNLVQPTHDGRSMS